MAGDWIKFDASTPEKPEVLGITVAMGWDDPDLTVGKLLRVWRWFDQQTLDGNAASVSLALLNRIAGVSGFAEAMVKFNWLVVTELGIRLPNFHKHNGKTAKTRCQTAKRVANLKTNAETNAVSVSEALPREEKRREDIKPTSEQSPDKPKPKKWGTEEDHKAAIWIHGLLLKINPDHKEPNWDGWANEIRLMRENDKRTHRDICGLFKRANEDTFWRKNILSPAKLREKWDQLMLALPAGEGHPVAAYKQSDDPNWKAVL